MPSWKMNKGLGSADLFTKYAAMERTGQSGWFVKPRKMFIPLQNGSVLLCFIVTLMAVGFLILSSAMSLRLRCTPESYAGIDGQVNSAQRRNLKNPRQQAAQSIAVLWSVAYGSQRCLRRMAGEIGKCCFGVIPLDACSRLMPLSTFPVWRDQCYGMGHEDLPQFVHA